MRTITDEVGFGPIEIFAPAATEAISSYTEEEFADAPALNVEQRALAPQREEPATSAARIAASRRSTCSLLKMHPRAGEIECTDIAELWADVRLCPCPKWVKSDVLTLSR